MIRDETAAAVVQVYLIDGTIFEYDLKDPDAGRNHTHAIIMTGYRRWNKRRSRYEHYSPNSIMKVVVTGTDAETFKGGYLDRVLGT